MSTLATKLHSNLKVMPSKPWVIAHRGASGYRPEHTEEAYRLAIHQGADALEPDLVASHDGILVIRHDNELSGTTDVANHAEFADRKTVKVIEGHSYEGWFVEDFTWEELATLRARERIPAERPESSSFDGEFALLRFTDLLRICAEETVSLCVELKHASYFAERDLNLAELVERDLHLASWQVDDSRLIFESFEKTVLTELRARGVGSKHVYLMERGATAWDEIQWARAQGVPSLSYADELSDAALEIFATKLDALSLDVRYLVDLESGDNSAGRELVHRIHSWGLQVYTWTLRPERELMPPAWRKLGPSAQKGRGDWVAYFQAVYDTGVDAVFADHPDLAVSLRP